jgi:hypothetical protein
LRLPDGVANCFVGDAHSHVLLSRP